jgi:5'-methylthioadenosine phosphorylase
MLGIIGGTGLYSIDGLEIVESKEIDTPFGQPSSKVTIGRMGSQKVAFLPRHGAHHQISPTEINFRANIWALKSVGVKRIVSVSATGSLQQEIAPGSIVLIDQYFDWTKGKRNPSFFGNGVIAHVSAAEPACPTLTKNILKAADSINLKVFSKKTYACVEGPRFGTRAESFFLRKAGCDVVGMTNVPEAFIAREAQLCYCTIAVATDYDCWMDDPSQHVTVDKVLALYAEALVSVKKTLGALINSPYVEDKCKCQHALDGAMLTHENVLTAEQKKIWAFLKQ